MLDQLRELCGCRPDCEHRKCLRHPPSEEGLRMWVPALGIACYSAVKSELQQLARSSALPIQCTFNAQMAPRSGRCEVRNFVIYFLMHWQGLFSANIQ